MKTTEFKIPSNLKEQYERVMGWKPPEKPESREARPQEGLTSQEVRPLERSNLLEIRTPRALMQVEIVEEVEENPQSQISATRLNPVKTNMKDISRNHEQRNNPSVETPEVTLPNGGSAGVESPRKRILPYWHKLDRDDPCQEKIRHKLPNWVALPAALVILPLLFFGLGRATSSKKDNANAYFQAKEQILGLAASPEPKSSAKDYLLESKEAFKRAQEISQEKEFSDEDKNKVTNLVNLALQTLSDGIAKYPNEAALYFERATIYKALIQSSPEAKDKTRLDLEKAYQLAPNAPNVLALYGRFLVEENEIEKAKAIFDQLLQLLPKDSQDYQTVVGWRQQLEPTPTPTPSPTATLTPIPTETPTPTPQQDTSEESVPTTSEVELSPTPEENTSEVKSSDTSEVEL